MTMDQGILEEISGEKIRFTVAETIAAGDNHCEIMFEVV
jgi:hypothetical protein